VNLVKRKNIDIRKEEFSLALVWTKYQYHILLATLRVLNIDKSSVILILFIKAEKNINNIKGFKKIISYDLEEKINITRWPFVKNKLNKLLIKYDLNPKIILLRNFDSLIARVLFSKYNKAYFYLFEEGLGCYEERNYFGYPSGIKEIVRTILLRFYFSKGVLKILPILRNKTSKLGLFPSINPWLNIPYIPVTLNSGDFIDNKCEIQVLKKIKVLILEQPLWQVNVKDDIIGYAYKKLYNYLLENIKLEKDEILLKMHPSSNKNRVENIFKRVQIYDKIKILDTKQNLEELIFSSSLATIKIIISFNSSGLYLAKALIKEREVEIIAFSTKELQKASSKSYRVLENMNIVHIKG